MDTIETENSLGISFCERLPFAFTHGAGSSVWDEAGRKYLDFTSGWGVTCLGHAHPVLISALDTQAKRLLQGPNAAFTYSPERAMLLQTLRTVLPDHLARVYFCNSGAEANDAVLKLARKITGRSKVVSTLGGFHGRSMATLSVSRGPENPARFPPGSATTHFIRFGDSKALHEAIDSRTAALIVEPVQGEGGVQIADSAWLADAARSCREHGALLVLDEVQTGFCRTGKFFAHLHGADKLVPDCMTMGKGIAGGFPFAAFAVSEEVHSRLAPDDHGGTYCGNPLGCAVANAVVSYLRDHRVADRVLKFGQLLFEGLVRIQQANPSLVKEVRGVGFMCAMELQHPAMLKPLTRNCAEAGLLVVPTRNGIIRLLPDLLVSGADTEQGLAMLQSALSATGASSQY